jgi:putative inorganic carbon (HCO3(-)) transporter
VKPPAAPATSWTWPSESSLVERARVGAAALGLATTAIALLAAGVAQFGPPPVLVALMVAVVPLLLLLWPSTATVLVVLLLYVNFPAILTKQHGVPAVVAGAFVALLAFPLARAWVLRREPMRSDITLGFMLVMLGVMVLSSIAALDRRLAFDRVEAFVLEGLLLYWLILNAVRDLVTLRRVMWTMIAAGALLSTLCNYQEVTGSYTNEFGGLAYRHYMPTDEDAAEPGIERRRTWDRAQGPVDDPNRFAQISIVLLPLALFMYRRRSPRLVRFAAVTAGVLILTGIGLTLSRGAFLALGLLALALIGVKWLRASRVFLLALTGVAALSTLTPFLVDRIGSFTDIMSLISRDDDAYHEADGAIRRRTTEMLAAAYVFFDHPIIGVGPGQFSPFYIEEYSRNPDIKFREVLGPRRAHTLYLEIAAETGVLGLIVFLAIVGFTLAHLYQRRRQWADWDPERSELATAFALSLSAYLVTAVFLHMAFQQYFWLLLACCGTAVHVLRPPADRVRVWLR